MNSDIQRGRWLLIAIIIISLGGDGIVVLLKIAASGLDQSGTSIVRWFLTAAIFALIWNGAEWARWLAIGLYSIALLMAGRSILFQHAHPAMIALAFQFSVALVPLAFSSSIDAFMESQRHPSRNDSYARHTRDSTA